jgi:hypothetical protein
MKRFVLAVAAVATMLAALPASAQYPGGGYSGGPYGGGCYGNRYYDEDDNDYPRRRRPPPPPYGSPYGRPGPYSPTGNPYAQQQGYGQPAQRLGSNLRHCARQFPPGGRLQSTRHAAATSQSLA